MTFDDANEFIKQAIELDYKPRLIMIGGEPTLHPKFVELVKLARGQDNRPVQIYSNGFGERARSLCKQVNKFGASIFKDEWKDDSRDGDEEGPEWDLNMFVSPKDAGIDYFGNCYCHSSRVCGVGVDHNGYSICPIGLFFASLIPELKDTVTNRLSDIFDEEWARKATIKQCDLCGFMFHKRYGVTPALIKKFKDYAKTCLIINGMPMSPTWIKAFKGLEMKP